MIVRAIFAIVFENDLHIFSNSLYILDMADTKPKTILPWQAVMNQVPAPKEVQEAAIEFERDRAKEVPHQEPPIEEGQEAVEPPRVDCRTLGSRAQLERMSPSARALRELFAQEYVYDFRPIEAAKRCGFLGASARSAANRLMAEPAVQRLIKERQHEFLSRIDINQDEVIAAFWREAHLTDIGASHSARVAALTQVAKILGIAKPEGPEVNVNIGGVMEVPASTTVDEWEKQAVEQQAKLRADVRD